MREVRVGVFAFVNPETKEAAFVSSSTDPKARLRRDIHEARLGEFGTVNAWLRSVLITGVRPEVRVLEASAKVEASARETHWADVLGCPVRDRHESYKFRLRLARDYRRLRRGDASSLLPMDRFIGRKEDPDVIRLKAKLRERRPKRIPTAGRLNAGIEPGPAADKA